MADILEVLSEFGEIAWYRIPCFEDLQYHPELKVFPPFVTWRYKEKPSELAEQLTKAIQSFESTIGWSFQKFERTWAIYPFLSTNAIERERLAKTNPDYGIRAYDELPKLADHIRAFMRQAQP